MVAPVMTADAQPELARAPTRVARSAREVRSRLRRAAAAESLREALLVSASAAGAAAGPELHAKMASQGPHAKRQRTGAWCSAYSQPPATPQAARAAPAAADEAGEELPFHALPAAVLEEPAVPYVQVPVGSDGRLRLDASTLLAETPKPKSAVTFSSLHIVAAHAEAAETAQGLHESARNIGTQTHFYSWPALASDDVVGEYEALFRIASDMILAGADRSSLLAFVARDSRTDDWAVAAILGMLPFRGVQVALIDPSSEYVDPLGKLRTTSGLFEYDAGQPERMGRRPFAAVFGRLPRRQFQRALLPWRPLRPPPLAVEKPTPFKIGAMELPMVTYEGRYQEGVERLADLLVGHFGATCFPVVAVGETGDALGYGSDILSALVARGCVGHYFAHPSGESYKRPDAYGQRALLEAASAAKRSGRRLLVVAVGGGVNGNAMGMIAALVGADFVEVPTTLMHYNDATTSAKKAFSLVVDGKILSKNILGTFYLPQLVFCNSEVFLTLADCSVHAAVGESAKTMNMLGNCKTAQGQRDFYNILGAAEFVSDFTRILQHVEGFERLIEFLHATASLKRDIVAVGKELRLARERAGAGDAGGRHEALAARRSALLRDLHGTFHQGLCAESRQEIMDFLTTINEEVIRAKAMFLAYSDPFEKYRALLFEYAHTLGHGVEAFMNGLYERAKAAGLDFSTAFRLHGQCVGMAVVWAGEMSRRLGHLQGDGYLAHQSIVYLFNRFGGFDFAPLRRLCDDLGVSAEEFCEGVLRVVRRDNKRGYCRCAPGSSVDQLVRERPGCLVRSADPSAELRYLVEVSEASQRQVLERAFAGEYDRVLVCRRRPGQDCGADARAAAGLALVARAEHAEAQRSRGADGAAVVASSEAALALGRLVQALQQGRKT